MGALGFFETGTFHIQAVSFSLTLRILFTARRDSIVRLKLVILFVPIIIVIVGSWGGNIQVTIGIPQVVRAAPMVFPYLYRGKTSGWDTLAERSLVSARHLVWPIVRQLLWRYFICQPFS
jgi:hypothetical protein